MNHKRLYLFIFTVFPLVHAIVYPCYGATLQERSSIVVHTDKIIRHIDRGILGQNLLAYNRCKFKSCDGNIKTLKSSITGFGIWDPGTSGPEKELFQLLRDIEPASLRFPGGSPANYYDWKETIGPPEKRPDYQFGLDEFMRLCEVLQAVPILTLNYFTASDKDLFDLTEYLLAENDRNNPFGGVDWAAVRAANGHPSPYKIKWFEFGNEVYNSDIHRNTITSPEEYAKRYQTIRAGMKSISPGLQLGAVLESRAIGLSDWNFAVAKNLGKEMDFGVVHLYPFKYKSNSNLLSPGDVFSIALSSPEQVGKTLENISADIQKITGRKIPLAITEFNGGYFQEKPVPYRSSLGNALLIADLLRVFASTDVPLVSANFWLFANASWGMVDNPLYHEGKGHYKKRPVYLLYRLFSKYLGTDLVETTVNSPSYRSLAFGNVAAAGEHKRLTGINKIEAFPVEITPGSWKKRFASGVKVERGANILELEYPDQLAHNISPVKFNLPVTSGRRYKLSAQVKTKGIRPRSGVYLQVKDARNYDSNRWVTRTFKVEGTTGWTDVFAEFDLPAGCEEISVTVRRDDPAGDSQGTAWIKDVSIEDTGVAVSFPETKYLSALATVDSDGKIFLMVVNKNSKQDLTAAVNFTGVDPPVLTAGEAVTGKSMESIAEDEIFLLKEDHLQAEPSGNNLIIIFKRGSVTFLQFN